MKVLLPSLRAQLALVSLAAIVTAVVGVLLIREVLGNTEGLLVGEALRQTELAAEHLREQLGERLEIDSDSPLALPPPGRELSLRAITETVLAGFPTLEGGYWLGPDIGLAGSVGQPGDAGDAIAAACEAAARVGKSQLEKFPRGWDVWVVAASPLAGTGATTVAWSLRRLHDLRNPGRFRSNLYLGFLAATSVLAVGGSLAVAVRIRRQVNETTRGLRRLEKDLNSRLARSTGEFGEIAEAINRMAEQRLGLESELRRKELLAALGRLCAGVAHEVRNPLNNLQLTLELLLRDCPPPAVEGKYRQLLVEVKRMEGMVQQLLTLVRRDASSRTLQPLEPMLSCVMAGLAPYAERCQATFAWDFDHNAPDVAVHRAQIEQVFANVLQNAIEAAPAHSEVRVRLFCNQSHVAVSVADSGPGVTEPERGQVFEPFFSTKAQGVGLGLTISREIVEAHGGTIAFESGEAGTVVTVRLPLEVQP